MSPVLALLPPIPEESRHAEQLVLHPRREFVEVELAAPAAAWHACGMRAPAPLPRGAAPRPARKDALEKMRALGGRTLEEWREELPRRAGQPIDPEPGEIPLRFPLIRTSRNKTYPVKRFTKAEVAEARRVRLTVLPARPLARGECWNTIRPCRFFTCERHVKYDITMAGNLKDNFPGVDLRDMEETCTLDVADQGSQTIARIARVMNLSEQRSLQLVDEALAEMDFKLKAMGIEESAEELLRHLAEN